MNRLFLITILFIANIGLIQAQYTAIPDPYFEQELIDEGIDTEGILDGQVLTSDINTLTELSIFNTNASNLIGIEGFTALIELDISGNMLLSHIDLSGNLQLVFLNCFSNALNSINVNSNLNLETLWVGANYLTAIDISNNTNLINFDCGVNFINELDVSNNVELVKLWCNTNNLNTIDISTNTNIQEFSCASNNITLIDASQNQELYYFVCADNELIKVDLRNGNNQTISHFSTIYNPNLTCIFVDNAVYSTENWSSGIDETSTFVETQAECDALGIMDNSVMNNLYIYPNPVEEKLMIEISNDKIKSLKLFNIIGDELLETKNTDYLDVKRITCGVYFLKVITVNGIEFTHKIIIK